MLCVLCEKDYEQSTCLCSNGNLRQEIEFGCCLILFGMVALKKGDSVRASSHYFALLHFAKLVSYAFMGHNLTIIYVLYAFLILYLLMLHTIACYDRSNM